MMWETNVQRGIKSAKQGRHIAIVGASGGLGSETVKALLAYGVHTVTAISRAESTATFPPEVKVQKGSYDDQEFLVAALQGQDVLILQMGAMAVASQIPLIHAAAKANVPWVIPCEYASDNKHEKLNQEIGLMRMKTKYRELIEQLGVSNWIGVVNNPWFDWSFKRSYWGIDVLNRKAVLFDGASVKFNTTTLPKVGKSLAALLTIPDSMLWPYRNDFVYFSSFYLTQRDILDSVMRATKTNDTDWTIEEVSAADVARAAKEAISKGDGMKNINLLFAIIFREGFGGDYEAKVTDNEMLGLEQEDLDQVIRELVQDMEINK